MSRKRWVYTQGGEPLPQPIEVSDDWKNITPRTGDGLKFVFDNLRATDGADISSYSKHQRYMQERGLALQSDFRETGEKARKQREASFTPEYDKRERREVVGRALYEARRKRR